ncbi:MAG: helix-hairpin-helix domain-containing protein [Mogibacterium sp.]|nr:helix-hairpin-helix domain-containing protein [Mogibacterium sp.]
MRAAPERGGIAGLYYKDRKGFMKILLICCIIVVTLVFSLISRDHHTELIPDQIGTEASQEAEGSGQEDASDAETQTFTTGYVDISGAVNVPGVYQVTSETRLYELIEKAGGLKETADIDQINQASFVEDGMKIIIPEIGQTVPEDAGAAGVTRGAGKVNINTADKAVLMTLPGIGEAYAERIIEYRSSEPFKKIEDLKNISGIGEATFNKLKDLITV